MLGIGQGNLQAASMRRLGDIQSQDELRRGNILGDTISNLPGKTLGAYDAALQIQQRQNQLDEEKRTQDYNQSVADQLKHEAEMKAQHIEKVSTELRENVFPELGIGIDKALKEFQKPMIEQVTELNRYLPSELTDLDYTAITPEKYQNILLSAQAKTGVNPEIVNNLIAKKSELEGKLAKETLDQLAGLAPFLGKLVLNSGDNQLALDVVRAIPNSTVKKAILPALERAADELKDDPQSFSNLLTGQGQVKMSATALNQQAELAGRTYYSLRKAQGATDDQVALEIDEKRKAGENIVSPSQLASSQAYTSQSGTRLSEAEEKAKIGVKAATEKAVVSAEIKAATKSPKMDTTSLNVASAAAGDLTSLGEKIAGDSVLGPLSNFKPARKLENMFKNAFNDADLAAFNTKASLVSKFLASAFEGGKLSDMDFVVYTNSLPKTEDSVQSMRNKTKALQELVSRAKENNANNITYDFNVIRQRYGIEHVQEFTPISKDKSEPTDKTSSTPPVSTISTKSTTKTPPTAGEVRKFNIPGKGTVHMRFLGGKDIKANWKEI